MGSQWDCKHRTIITAGKTTDMGTSGTAHPPADTRKVARTFAPTEIRSKPDARRATVIGTRRHYRTSTNALTRSRITTDGWFATRERTVTRDTDAEISQATGATMDKMTGQAASQVTASTTAKMTDQATVKVTTATTAKMIDRVTDKVTDAITARTTEAPAIAFLTADIRRRAAIFTP